MNVLLTHGYFLNEDGREKEIMKPYPPLGILSLSAWLKRSGIENSLFDSTFSTREKLEAFLLAKTPRFVCIYVNLMTRVNVISLIRFIRGNPEFDKTYVILGGPEVTYNAEGLLAAGADFIVIGEGEETLTELVNTLSVPFNPFVSTVKGIVFKNALGELISTPEREKLKDIDRLPIPNREGIDMSLYLKAWKERHGINAISVSTMRGCPYTCKWCSRAVYGLSYRRRSAASVVQELKFLCKEYQPDSFWFVDDVFTVSHKWLKEFHDELKKENVSIRYECITRADRMNEEVVKLLHDSGCFRVWVGAESGSQKVIDLMDRRVDVQQVREMILLAKANGIEAGTFIMLGYPGEEKEDIEETIRHLVASDPDHFTITTAYPIKGTPFHTEISEQIIDEQPFDQTNDRETKFKRNYSDKFYHYAVRRVVNEVNFHKRRKGKNRSLAKAMIHKSRALAASLGMWWNGKRIDL